MKSASVSNLSSDQHAAYLLQHLEMAGFNQAQRALLVALVQNQSGPIHLASLREQHAVTNLEAERLCRLMQLV